METHLLDKSDKSFQVATMKCMVKMARWFAIAFLLGLAVLSAQASGLQDLGNFTIESAGQQTAVGAGEILAKIESDQPVSYDNITLSGELDLSNLDGPIRQQLRITNSTILNPANFEEVTFQALLDLRGTTFKERTNFAKAQFQGDATFGGTKFSNDSDFRFAKFDRSVSFSKARFDGLVSFSNSQFDGNANFEGSDFKDEAKFDLVQFFRPTTFMSATFSKDLSFTNSQLGTTSIFMNCKFKDNASFAGTRFVSDVIFRSSQFSKDAVFGLASFGGFSDFANVNFQGDAFFAVAKFSDIAHFLNAKFKRDLILENSRIYSMQLDNATFEKGSKINLIEADFTRLVVPWATIKDRLEFNGAAYLALVKNYKNLEWFDDADNCYYQYRQISQANEPWGWTKLIDVISWLSCGYGARVSYTVFWCFFTILFFGLIFWAGNGMRRFEYIGLEIPSSSENIQNKRVSLIDALYFSVAMFTTSQAPVNNYPVGVYRHLAMIEGILGWFFLGLFVVVLSGLLIR
jgi:hypothetical protein